MRITMNSQVKADNASIHPAKQIWVAFASSSRVMDQRKLNPGLVYHLLLVLHHLRAGPVIPFTQDEAL